MSHKSDHWLSWIFATVGVAGAGFAAGLHRLVWGLFWVVVVIWGLFCWWGGSKSHGDEQFMWWLLALGPALVVGFVLRIVEGIVFALLGGSKDTADPSTPSSRHNEPGAK